MSYVLDPPGGGAPTIINPRRTYPIIGRTSNGVGTAVGSSETLGAKGSWVSLGAAPVDLQSFALCMHLPSANFRNLVNVRLSGGAPLITEVQMHSGQGISGTIVRVPMPFKVLAGQTIEVQISASVLGVQTSYFWVSGVSASDQSPPGYTLGTPLNIDAAVQQAIPDVPLTNAWTVLASGLAASASALLLISDRGSANPATSQTAEISIGIGNPGSEVELFAQPLYMNSLSPGPRSVAWLYENDLASGEIISARAIGASTADNIKLGVWALV